MTDKPDGKLTSAALLDRRTKRRNWQAVLVVIMGVAIVGALIAMMSLVSAHLP
jgi:hypothetical protein